MTRLTIVHLLMNAIFHTCIQIGKHAARAAVEVPWILKLHVRFVFCGPNLAIVLHGWKDW